MAMPDQLPQKPLVDNLIDKSEFRRPNFVEENAADSRHKDFCLRIAKDSLALEVRIPEADTVVNLKIAFAVRHLELAHASHDRKVLDHHFVWLSLVQGLEIFLLLVLLVQASQQFST